MRVYGADVRDADAMARAAEDFLGHFGCPDVVIANAGVSVGTVASEREDLDAFRRVMDTNWFGVLTTTIVVICGTWLVAGASITPLLREPRRARIVNVTLAMALVGGTALAVVH